MRKIIFIKTELKMFITSILLVLVFQFTTAQTICNNEIGDNGGYTYEYWKDSGSGCMTLGAGGTFSVDWSNIGNLLARKGIRPGSMNQTITYGANYQPNGNSYLCVYGWTTSPLVEYYIVESYGDWRPPGDVASKGTFTTDGGTYEIFETTRTQQPSIEGTQTFQQYWSVRTSKRTSGTITCANHFNAWASVGMNMGDLYEVSLTVEGYQSSGTCDVYEMSMGTSSGGNTGGGTTGGGNTGGGSSNQGDGEYTLTVRAMGVAGGEHLNVLIDGQVQAEINLSTNMQDHEVYVNRGDLTLEYDNDEGDRDVQVDYIQIHGETKQAEDQEYNTGVYQNDSCGGSFSEMMHCSGEIGFGDITNSTETGGGTTGGGNTGGGTNTSDQGNGEYTLTVRAMGVAGGEHLNVLIDGQVQASINLSTNMQDHDVYVNGGDLTLEYDNDEGDRDVQIDYIQIHGETKQAEDQEHNTGVYQNDSCGGSYSEMMHCSGEIGFGNITNSTDTGGGDTGGGNTGGGTSDQGDGEYTLTVRAMGVAGGEHLNVLINGQAQASINLSTNMQDYDVYVNRGDLTLEYDNDEGDRDVQIDYIQIHGETKQAEDQEHNTGVYQNDSCGGSFSEMMHCSGEIGFGDITNSSGGNTTGGNTGGGNTTGNCNGYYALTFDDGPTNDTNALLNILDNAGVKATFFPAGNRISSNPSAFQAMINGGHNIENHSHTHSHMLNWSYQQVYNDIQQAQQTIQNAGGGTPTLFRPPYGETNSTITAAANAIGLTVVTWDVDSQDWDGASTATIVSNANSLQNGGVILMHDGYSSTNNAIQTIVNNLSSNGLCAGSINNNGDAVAWSTSTNTGGNNTGSSSNSITIRARGTDGSESINLQVNGTTIETWTLSTSYQDYTVTTASSGDLLVEYTNDSSGLDVQIDYVQINGETRQAEDQSHNTAVYQNSSCGGEYSEMMHCSGEIGFGSFGSAARTAVNSSVKIYNYTIEENIPATNVQIFPNPATNTIEITLPLDNGASADVQIYSLTGSIVVSQKITVNNRAIDVSYLENGLYIVKITADGQVINKQIIKQ